MAGLFRYLTGGKGPTGFGSSSTAEQVSEGVDLTGKVAIVTGGASGIGQETSRVLALRGAHVILAVRNVDAGKKAADEIKAKQGDATVSVLPLDLSSLASVRTFAADFAKLGSPLHILVNNAGVMATPFKLSKDGHELQFATNYLGHFLLTKSLLPKLKETAESAGDVGRIVNVSSYAYVYPYKEGIRFDKLDSPDGYSPWQAYGQSKLASILHARELSRRLKEEGAPVVINAVHPGGIRTNLQRDVNQTLNNVLFGVTGFLMKSIPQGAATSVYLAANPAAKEVSGKYFSDVNEEQTTKLGEDSALAKKLWEVTEELIA